MKLLVVGKLVAGKLGKKKEVEDEFFILSFHGCLCCQVEKGLS